MRGWKLFFWVDCGKLGNCDWSIAVRLPWPRQKPDVIIGRAIEGFESSSQMLANFIRKPVEIERIF
jgi:hypothetical protein